MPNQYNYSRIAGGDTNTCPSHIREAFMFILDDCSGSRASVCGSSYGSAHYLKDIQKFLENKWNFPAQADVQACSGCHNPHRTQRDNDQTAQRFLWVNGVSSLSRPSQHSKDNNVWELWGDNSTERMSNYNYQPPYRYNSNTTYEPDGYSISDASRTIDFVTFCTDCHNTTYTISSTPLGTLRQINWSSSGDIHGAAIQPGCTCDCGDKKPPYTDGTNYTMSCLDCHEPHGSPNEYLLRQEINGVQVPIITSRGRWYYVCTACHTNLNKHTGGIPTPGTGTDCSGCHHHSYGDTYPRPNCCPSNCGSYVNTF